MLEATANFIGKDGFNWWVGQVENNGGDNKDPDFSNKVKVRILGYHNPKKAELATKDLPWSMVAMPVTTAQRSGIGSLHQLQVNSWVIGFFMDGSASQIPIVMGSIGDENPQGGYATEPPEGEDGEPKPFAQLVARDYKPNAHGGQGSSVPNTGDTVAEDEDTGNTVSAPANETSSEGTVSSANPLPPKEPSSENMTKADEQKCVTVEVGNGKCDQELATKLEGPLAEFMKFGRGLEQNAIGQYIDKVNGKVVDLEERITSTANRIQSKMNGITANIKGVVMEEVNKLVRDGLDKINVPNPDLDNAVKKQLKDVGGLVSCLFKQLLDELLDFIKGMLSDLLSNILDTALCLIQDLIGDLLGALMDKIKSALSMLKGVMGAIKGAAAKIQGLLRDIMSMLDLFCDGELSCAIGASVFETCHGAVAKGNDAKAKQEAQYPVKPPNGGAIIGDGKPKGGFVPFLEHNSLTGVQKVFNVNTGALVDLASPAGIASGLTAASFDTRGPLEKFEGLNFYDSSGKIQSSTVNCNNSILNKKPCFPEMVWDNLQSTSPIKALPIIDSIGSVVGTFIHKKGSGVSLEAKVRAMFTCNEPEGGGATFKANIKDGQLQSVDVLTPGIGYGFDPAEIYCPKEQYVVEVPKAGLVQHLNDGDYLRLSSDPTKPDVMQVIDVDWNEDMIMIGTIDPTWVTNLESGITLETVSGHQFLLNFDRKYPKLVVPMNAKAVWAQCGDLIPSVAEVKPINVGRDYVEPVITIGSGEKEKEIGTISVDSKGRLVEPKITKKVLGFVTPKVKDKHGKGSGAELIVNYTYTGPKELIASGVLELKTYIDCVGHPEIQT